jgi:urea transporter
MKTINDRWILQVIKLMNAGYTGLPFLITMLRNSFAPYDAFLAGCWIAYALRRMAQLPSPSRDARRVGTRS